MMGAASAVLLTLYLSVVVKSEMSCKAKRCLQFVHISTLTYDHKL